MADCERNLAFIRLKLRKGTTRAGKAKTVPEDLMEVLLTGPRVQPKAEKKKETEDVGNQRIVPALRFFQCFVRVFKNNKPS